jgi:hypothetical protein
MTVAALAPSAAYLENGVTLAFAAPFRFLSAAHLEVKRVSAAGVVTTLVHAVDYTVTGGASDAGGTVTLGASVAGATLKIRRVTPRAQQTDYATGDTFPAESHEAALDRQMLIDQEQDVKIDDTAARALLVPEGETANVLPARQNGKFVATDAGGQFIFASGTGADGALRADLAASGGSALVGQLASGAGATARAVQDKLRDHVAAKDFGAVGDGVADDRAALVLADAAGPFRLSPGSYKVSANLTITNDIVVAPGAKLVIPNAVTVTINGQVLAGVQHIFQCTGTGAVVISAQKTRTGYPEWWGAISNNSAGGIPAANTTYFGAACTALSKVELQATDYYLSGVLKINRGNLWLAGAGSKWDSVNGLKATRLVGMDGTSDVLQVGPDADPGGIGLFTQGMKITGIEVTRAVAPAVGSAANSIRCQFLLEAYFEDVRASESIQGWLFNGTVHCIAYNCAVKRTSAGTGGTDLWKGFYIYGGSGIAAGGNASLYLDHCTASDTRAVKTNSIGFYADIKFTDCFLLHCESVSCTVGIEINGNDSATNDSGSTDLTIIQPVMDAFATYGIFVHNMGLSGSVEVVSPYCGPASGATSAIQIDSNRGGAVTITGGQLVMTSASGCKGITIDANGQVSGAVTVNGTIIAEAGANGAVILADAKNCRIMPVVVNDSTTGGPAVQVINASTANYIAPIVKGKASGSTFGIQVVGTTDARNEYNCSGIDSGTINGGAGNKLVRNGVQIVATGLTGTNLASGVMT